MHRDMGQRDTVHHGMMHRDTMRRGMMHHGMMHHDMVHRGMMHYGMVHRRTMIVLFVLVNVLPLCLGLLWGWRGPLAELERLRTANRLMESRLAIKERNYSAQDTHQQRIESLAAEAAEAQIILAYDRVGAALDEVRQSAESRALSEVAFETREPVIYTTDESGIGIGSGYDGINGTGIGGGYDGISSGGGFGDADGASYADGGRIVEIKAEAAYTGLYEDICDFVADLLESRAGYRIDRLTITIDPTNSGLSNARLDFYIYAVEVGIPQ